MDFSLMTEPQIGMTYAEQLEAALWCESNDISVFARADHYLSSKEAPHVTDAMATLAGLARDTTTVRLCLLVSPISFRHPAVIAKSAATIDEMSGGRVMLGVGTGWMELEHDAFGLELWDLDERFARLTDALGYLRAAFGPGEASYDGTHYSLTGVDVRPKPVGPMPLIVGGSGPRRTPRLAGTFADEYNLFVAAPDSIATRARRARDAATAAGRKERAFELTVMGPIVTGRDAASYQGRLEAMAASRGRSPDEQSEILERHSVPHGPPDQVRAMLADLEAAGVSRFYVQTLGSIDYTELAETLEVVR